MPKNITFESNSQNDPTLHEITFNLDSNSTSNIEIMCKTLEQADQLAKKLRGIGIVYAMDRGKQNFKISENSAQNLVIVTGNIKNMFDILKDSANQLLSPSLIEQIGGHKEIDDFFKKFQSQVSSTNHTAPIRSNTFLSSSKQSSQSTYEKDKQVLAEKFENEIKKMSEKYHLSEEDESNCRKELSEAICSKNVLPTLIK